MNRLLLIGICLWLTLPGWAQKNAVSQRYVERMVKALSADALMGRGNFTPGLSKAADLIAAEFRKTGLQPLPEQTSFQQSFTVYRTKPGAGSVQLGGVAVPPENVLVVSQDATLQWENPVQDSVAVVTIGTADDFAKRAREIRKTNAPTLVLVHPAHQEIFQSFREYFSEGNIRLARADTATPPSASYVFVLTDALAAPDFQVSASSTTDTLRLANVAGIIPGTSRKNEMVVFSAHYDHIGILEPANGDSIANGADDDASGTTAVMALARHFKKLKNNARTLVFVAFAAEEIGGYGSQYFSRQLNPDQVTAMFNIEMIGKPSKFGPNTAWITGYEKSDFGKILQQNLANTNFAFHPDPYPQQNLFYRSDNATLARLGVPAHSISTDEIDIDKLYHSVDDEFASLNIANMTQVIRAIALSARSIVAGKDTPTRVEAAKLD